MLIMRVVILLKVSLLFIISSRFVKGDVYCSLHACDGNKCISDKWVCNGVKDCNDGSDENDCDNMDLCEHGGFYCHDGIHCLLQTWVCDGEMDCRDGSDELDCHNYKCSKGMLKCSRGDICIDEQVVCDGVPDCPGGTDESKDACASKKCRNGEFRCDGGHKCLQRRWLCNGIMDCDDGSDERNCSVSSEMKKGCSEDEFQCKLSSHSSEPHCIQQSHVCDGLEDCSDGSDESGCSSRVDVNINNGDDLKGSTNSSLCNVSSHFRCHSTGACLPMSARCDGINQCDDSSDEMNCNIEPELMDKLKGPRYTTVITIVSISIITLLITGSVVSYVIWRRLKVSNQKQIRFNSPIYLNKDDPKVVVVDDTKQAHSLVECKNSSKTFLTSEDSCSILDDDEFMS